MANPEHLAILKQGVEAWNSWRKKHGDVQPDLSQANLADAVLWDANLRSANLEQTDFSGAKLAAARFWGSNLTGALLRKADLSYADFSTTNLSKANLLNAHIGCTYIRKANVAGCRFHGARTSYTTFVNLDLSAAEGLVDEISHFRPSSVDADTLELTAAGLSKNPANQGAVEAFFRGAGLQEHTIAFFRSLIGRPIEFYSCFIGYNHVDKAFARRLHDQLQAHGIRCWLDEHQLLPGDQILDEIDRGIRLWDKVLLCCSRESLASIWVDREIEKALRKEERLWNERGKRVLAIIPLDLDGYLLEWQSSKADLLQERLAADFTGWEHDNNKFEDQFERVVTALRADEAAREKAPEAKL